jgi:hypothetical protein
MGNPQKVKFRNLAEFNNALPDHELEIVELLRESIHTIIPDIRERLAYNVPFFYRRSRVCFIWPASIPWGGITSGVSLGFINARWMTSLPVLPLKQIATVNFLSLSEINITDLEVWLFEAVQIDEDRFRQSRSK